MERLFSLSELKAHLTFKGGTSLSKVYDLIQRSSEDIDVSIEKYFLGYNKVKDPEKAESKKKQKAAVTIEDHDSETYVSTSRNFFSEIKVGTMDRLIFHKKINGIEYRAVTDCKLSM